MNGVVRIPVHGGLEALIDADDLALVGGRKWWRSSHHRTCVYAYTMDGRKTLRMHRLIMGAKKGQNVDHINGDGLDNRKSNLRFCTIEQNKANMRPRSWRGLKGVEASKGGFRGSINVRGVRHRMATRAHWFEAAVDHDRMAVEAHGEFAWINFPCITPRTPATPKETDHG